MEGFFILQKDSTIVCRKKCHFYSSSGTQLPGSFCQVNKSDLVSPRQLDAPYRLLDSSKCQRLLAWWKAASNSPDFSPLSSAFHLSKDCSLKWGWNKIHSPPLHFKFLEPTAPSCGALMLTHSLAVVPGFASTLILPTALSRIPVFVTSSLFFTHNRENAVRWLGYISSGDDGNIAYCSSLSGCTLLLWPLTVGHHRQMLFLFVWPHFCLGEWCQMPGTWVETN